MLTREPRMPIYFVLNALIQVLRPPTERDGAFAHHLRWRASPIRLHSLHKALAEVGIASSGCGNGDICDNALAVTSYRLHKAEVIHCRAWPTCESMELITSNGCHGSTNTGCSDLVGTSNQRRLRPIATGISLVNLYSGGLTKNQPASSKSQSCAYQFDTGLGCCHLQLFIDH